MAIEWRNLRVPAELHDRLAALADSMLQAHQAGRIELPGQHVEQVPLYHVITRALDEMEAHRARARRQVRRHRRARTGPVQGGDVYIINEQESVNV